jgi:hypothetical protein
MAHVGQELALGAVGRPRPNGQFLGSSHRLFEPRVGRPQVLLGSPALGDVAHRGADEWDCAARVRPAAVEPGVKRGTVLPPQRQLAALFRPSLEHTGKMAIPPRKVLGCNESPEAVVDQVMTHDPQERRPGKIRLGDQVLAGESEVSDGGKIEEVDVLAPGVLQRELGRAEFIVLHLQLNLVYPKLVDELLERFLANRLRWDGGRGELLLGRSPQS